MSAFMVNTNVMAKVVTAILLNLDTFDGESTRRTALLAAPTISQKEAGTKIGRKLFLMNRRALGARYGCRDHLHLPEFVFEKWAEATPVEQFKAISCLLYQCSESKVPSSPLLWRAKPRRRGTRAAYRAGPAGIRNGLLGRLSPAQASSAAVEGATGVRRSSFKLKSAFHGFTPRQQQLARVFLHFEPR